MALFRNLECRHLVIDGNRTSVAIEPIFWRTAEMQAQAQGILWHEWATARLGQGIGGRASRLRVAILTAACN